MKTHKRLWPLVVAPENLLEAALKAQRGKRLRPDVAAFNVRLEENLFRLQDELESGAYVPGPYRTWTVYERKPRLICAAPYRDRVVHHALCNIIEPLFERGFIDDSYACRAGKGTHASLRRVEEYARLSRCFLRLDVRRYFPSIDHAILRGQLARRIGDARVLDLIDGILASFCSSESIPLRPDEDLVSAAERARGLPLGNQTSQFFANVYLDGFDHFVKETLRCRRYVRYVDDLVLFADDKATLWAWLGEMAAFLAGLRLWLKDERTQLAPVGEGLGWVGYRVLPTHTRLRNDNPHCFRRRFRGVVWACRAGEVSRAEAKARWAAWRGHANHADAEELCRQVWNWAVG